MGPGARKVPCRLGWASKGTSLEGPRHPGLIPQQPLPHFIQPDLVWSLGLVRSLAGVGEANLAKKGQIKKWPENPGTSFFFGGGAQGLSQN